VKRATLTLVLVLIGHAGPAHAQSDTTSHRSRGERIFIRSLVGYAGAIPVLVVGATIGSHVQRAYYPELSGDDPGLWGIAVGGMAGAALGGIIFAAVPRLGSSCTLGRRLARSTGGTAAVLAVAATVLYVVNQPQEKVSWIAPVTPIISATVQGRC
jgi:hypothetical protein